MLARLACHPAVTTWCWMAARDNRLLSASSARLRRPRSSLNLADNTTHSAQIGHAGERHVPADRGHALVELNVTGVPELAGRVGVPTRRNHCGAIRFRRPFNCTLFVLREPPAGCRRCNLTPRSAPPKSVILHKRWPRAALAHRHGIMQSRHRRPGAADETAFLLGNAPGSNVTRSRGARRKPGL